MWFVREAWPSPATGTSQVAGELSASAHLSLTVESEGLIAFGDGMEADAVELTWGQTVRGGGVRGSGCGWWAESGGGWHPGTSGAWNLVPGLVGEAARRL